MKIVMPAGTYTFTPGASTIGNIDFSGFSGFTQENLFAVINTDASGNPLIFSTSGGAALGGSFSGPVLFLNFDTSGMNSGDILQVIYDDPNAVQQIGGDIDLTTRSIVGPTQGTVSDDYFDGSPSIATGSSKSFSAQVISSAGAIGTIFFEGSNDGTNWDTIYPQQVDDLVPLLVNGCNITPSRSDTFTGPINYSLIRARSNTGFGAGTITVLTTLYQTPPTPSIISTQLLTNTGRTITFGSGVIDTETIRVVTADNSPTIYPDVYINGTGQTVINTNLLTGTTAALDCANYRSIGIQINGGASITGGQVIWEGSNDNVNFSAQILIPPDNTTPTAVTGAISITSSSVRQLCGSLPFRYYRLRISTGFTGGGSVRAIARLSPNHYTGMTIPVVGSVTASISGSVTLGGGTVTAATLAGALTADISSGTITSTTTSSSVTYASIQSVSLSQIVTASSGTNQTLDTVVQCSMDNGTNWFDVYHFPRATGTGQWYSPPMKLRGVALRYVRTLGGTSPSFTMAINRNAYQTNAPIIGAFFDRTVAPNTLNSTTPSYFIEGCDEFTMVVNMGAITTTAPEFQLEGSEDNTNFYSIGSPLTTVASSTVMLSASSISFPKFIRARVSTAGSGATLGYVSLKGTNG